MSHGHKKKKKKLKLFSIFIPKKIILGGNMNAIAIYIYIPNVGNKLTLLSSLSIPLSSVQE